MFDKKPIVKTPPGGFNKAKILKGVKKPKPNRWKRPKGWKKWATAALIFILLLIGFKIVLALKKTTTTQVILSVVSSPVEQDKQNHTNILILGVGDKGHEGRNLTDTIMLASYDHDDGAVSTISIPRDLYIDTDLIGGNRVNALFALSIVKLDDEEKALKYTSDQIGNMLDIPIHYYIKVNFSAVEDIVDALNGVDIELAEALYDPEYPDDDNIGSFDPLHIPEGLNTLDGETALKYVRSRKTTSDFDRALRQQKLISAIKEKALSLKILANPNRIKALFESFQNNVTTNMTWQEVAYIAKEIDKKDNITFSRHVLSDDPYIAGGLLYTPERDLYEGSFVLVPFTNTDEELQLFSKLALYNYELFEEKIPIHVLNATETEGLAFDAMNYLDRYGFNTVKYGNAVEEELEKTQIHLVFDQKNQTMKYLPRFIQGAISSTPEHYLPENFTTEAGIIVVLGKDFEEFRTRNYKRFYVHPDDATLFGGIPAETYEIEAEKLEEDDLDINEYILKESAERQTTEDKEEIINTEI